MIFFSLKTNIYLEWIILLFFYVFYSQLIFKKLFWKKYFFHNFGYVKYVTYCKYKKMDKIMEEKFLLNLNLYSNGREKIHFFLLKLFF
jgi:hypothetical protein